jgi:hypothetical protein
MKKLLVVCALLLAGCSEAGRYQDVPQQPYTALDTQVGDYCHPVPVTNAYYRICGEED